MAKSKMPTVEELEAMLRASLTLSIAQQAAMQKRFAESTGTAAEEQPQNNLIVTKMFDRIADTIARRLKRNRRTVPLVSIRDLTKLIPEILDASTQDNGNELDIEVREALIKYTQTLFKNLLSSISETGLPGEDPYEWYQRWAKTALEVAAGGGISPAELVATESGSDEITRRMYTRKQYVARCRRSMKKIVSIPGLKKILLDPLLSLLIEKDSEDYRETKRDLETEATPKIAELVEKYKQVFDIWIDETATRIYGP